MSMEVDYQFENFEEYYGDIKQVKKIIAIFFHKSSFFLNQHIVLKDNL